MKTIPAQTRCAIKCSGFGGQGVITLGLTIGTAAMKAGSQVVMTRSYGPESRGGACSSDVVIDDRPILSAAVEHPDILVAFSHEALSLYARVLAPGGLLLADDILMEAEGGNGGSRWPGVAVVWVPATRIAEEAGASLSANMAMFGALIGGAVRLNPGCAEEAVRDCVPPSSLKLNSAAYQQGFQWALERRWTVLYP
ncbi:MAG: 2-oxoacid:acceptor oxidoreductase family protein, partial [Acidobacteria bacterium]|nr:2-oxoacid:acceptor oxidoreductase family protein [Acidobacteriota bacterium]